jgi:hypothetical protein
LGIRATSGKAEASKKLAADFFIELIVDVVLELVIEMVSSWF